MNEIEKLYENVGVKPVKQGYCDHYCYCPYPDIRCGDDCPYWKYEDEAKYPPFTAEEQLSLIKWLGYRRHTDIDIYNIKGCTIYDISSDYDCIIDEHKFMFDSNTFEGALAGLINQMWYSLTPEEKKQIRDILKGLE